MKISVDIDCTPQEMRTFFGLPDVEPMQQAVLEEMQHRMIASMDQISPTTLLKEWMAPMGAMQQAFLGAFTNAAQGAASAAGAAGGRTRGTSSRRRRTDDDSES